MTEFGVQSMTAPLRRVAVRDIASADFAAAGWSAQPDLEAAARQHAAFVDVLRAHGTEVDVLPNAPGLADACFTYDPVMVTGAGMIELRQIKPARVAEPPVLAAELAALGVPALGFLSGPAHADGGDLMWLDDRTLAAGRGYRTNQAAHDQLRDLLAPEGVTVETYDLPHDRGPAEVLHLMSVVSLVGPHLAVVFEPIAPVPLLQALAERDIEWVAATPEEYDALGTNLLATGPDRAIIFTGAPRIADELRTRGADVTELDMSEFFPGTGGPTCLTRPLWRA